jgi:uncharacterized membrane protein YedE/YeeE
MAKWQCSGYIRHSEQNNTTTPSQWNVALDVHFRFNTRPSSEWRFFSFALPEQIDLSWPLIIVGGFFVGLGSKMGSGCTSGHGICGFGRASPRSLTATVVFMTTAMIVVYVVKHLVGAEL